MLKQARVRYVPKIHTRIQQFAPLFEAWSYTVPQKITYLGSLYYDHKRYTGKIDWNKLFDNDKYNAQDLLYVYLRKHDIETPIDELRMDIQKLIARGADVNCAIFKYDIEKDVKEEFKFSVDKIESHIFVIHEVVYTTFLQECFSKRNPIKRNFLQCLIEAGADVNQMWYSKELPLERVLDLRSAGIPLIKLMMKYGLRMHISTKFEDETLETHPEVYAFVKACIE